MPNIKSAKRRVKTSTRDALKNVSIRSKVRTALKGAREAIEANDAAAIKSALALAFAEVDKAVKRKVFHKNAAARYKSRLVAKIKTAK